MDQRFSMRMIGWMGMVMMLAACEQNSSPPPSVPPPPPAAASPAPPPRQNPPASGADDRSLAFINLDVSKFGMEAIQANKKRAEANPSDGEALTQLGHANYMIQRVPTAKDYYEQAVRADGKLLEARLGLSNAYALMGQLDEALRELDRLLAIDRAHPEALFNRGLLLLYGKQDRAGAKQAWEQLVASHPGSGLGQRASAQLARLS